MSEEVNVLAKRRAGVLLHPTSLPESIGNGDLGNQAYYFVDFLANSGMSIWQMLPLGPTHEDLSPYQSQSVHAANPLLISLDKLVEKGWLEAETPPKLETAAEIQRYRYQRLRAAHQGFKTKAKAVDHKAYDKFVQTQHFWLEDFALFRALKTKYNGVSWTDWDEDIRDRKPSALTQIKKELHDDITQQYFEQFAFYSQWQALRDYARQKGVHLFGDIPIFVAHDSADVWAKPKNFLLDEKGKPTVVAGVPPDYFSKTGQLWGNPLYNWKYIQRNGFKWWVERLESAYHLFDLVRIDHFRGFAASWTIPAEAETAIDGEWVKVPGMSLFNKIKKVSKLAVVAEDLGVITDDVVALREKFNLPGMKILQFAFDGDPNNAYLPHNHVPNCVVYTGTHDNDTTLGWFQDMPDDQKQFMRTYLGSHLSHVPWFLIRAAMASTSQLAVIPMQDILGLDSEHRMNMPGTMADKNWRWRFDWSQVPDGVTDRLLNLSKTYARV